MITLMITWLHVELRNMLEPFIEKYSVIYICEHVQQEVTEFSLLCRGGRALYSQTVTLKKL